MPVARGTVDGHAGALQRRAGRVNIVDPKRQMPEIAAAIVARLIPIVGQLDLGDIVARAEEDQREPALRDILAAALVETEQLEEGNRRLRIGHAQHRVEEYGHGLGTAFVGSVGLGGGTWPSASSARLAASPIGPPASAAIALFQ